MKAKLSPSKKIVFWFLLVVFVLIAIFRIAKTEEILRVLATGRWYWIILAVLSQVCLYLFYAYYAGYVLRMFRIDLGFRNTLYAYLSSKFINVAVPISTVGVTMIFVRIGKKLNFPSLDVGTGASLIFFIEVTAFTIISIFTLLILSSFHQFQSYLLIPIFILTVFISGVIILLIRAVAAKGEVNSTLMKLILWFSHLFGIKQANRESIGQALKETSGHMTTAKMMIWKALGLAFCIHLINILTLALIFLAFAGHFNFLAILTGYIAGLLFTIISITPQGIGVAEPAMITAMYVYGVDLSTAAVITLAFRGLLYWLPMFAGFYAFSRLEMKQQVE